MNQSSTKTVLRIALGAILVCTCLGVTSIIGYRIWTQSGSGLLANLLLALETPTPPPTFTPTFTPLPSPTPPPTDTPTITPSPIPTDTPTPEVTLSPLQMAERLAAVLIGEGVSEAKPYDRSAKGPHRIVFLTRDGKFHEWNQHRDPAWVPATLDQVELVAVVTIINETVATAPYTGCGKNKIIVSRIRVNVSVTVYEAHTGKTVASNTFMGTDPPSFGWTLKCGQTAIYGEPPPYLRIHDWIRSYVQ